MPRDETSGGCPRRRGGARRWRQRRSRGGCRDRRATGRRGGTRSSVSPETPALSSRLQPPTQSTNQPDTPAGSGGLRLIGEAGPTGRVDVRLRSREGAIGIEGRWQAGSVVSCRGKGEEARNRGKRGRNGVAPSPGDLYHSCRWDELLQRPVSSGAATWSPQLNHFIFYFFHARDPNARYIRSTCFKINKIITVSSP